MNYQKEGVSFQKLTDSLEITELQQKENITSVTEYMIQNDVTT